MTTDEEIEEAEAEEVVIEVVEDQEVEVEEEEAEVASTLDSEVEEVAVKAATTTEKKERMEVSAETVHQEPTEDPEQTVVKAVKAEEITDHTVITAMSGSEMTDKEMMVVPQESEETTVMTGKEDHQEVGTERVKTEVPDQIEREDPESQEARATMRLESPTTMVRDQEEGEEAAAVVVVAQEEVVKENIEVGVKDVAEVAMTTQEEAAEAKEEAEVVVKAEVEVDTLTSHVTHQLKLPNEENQLRFLNLLRPPK